MKPCSEQAIARAIARTRDAIQVSSAAEHIARLTRRYQVANGAKSALYAYKANRKAGTTVSG